MHCNLIIGIHSCNSFSGGFMSLANIKSSRCIFVSLVRKLIILVLINVLLWIDVEGYRIRSDDVVSLIMIDYTCILMSKNISIWWNLIVWQTFRYLFAVYAEKRKLRIKKGSEYFWYISDSLKDSLTNILTNKDKTWFSQCWCDELLVLEKWLQYGFSSRQCWSRWKWNPAGKDPIHVLFEFEI